MLIHELSPRQGSYDEVKTALVAAGFPNGAPVHLFASTVAAIAASAGNDDKRGEVRSGAHGLQHAHHGRLAGISLTLPASLHHTLSIALALSLTLALSSLEHDHHGRLAVLFLTLNASLHYAHTLSHSLALSLTLALFLATYISWTAGRCLSHILCLHDPYTLSRNLTCSLSLTRSPFLSTCP